MRIALAVGVGVMRAVGRDPFDRAALQRQRAQDGHGVLERLHEFEAAMGEQAMESEHDANLAGEIVEHERDDDRTPGEHVRKKHRESADVNGCQPHACWDRARITSL